MKNYNKYFQPIFRNEYEFLEKPVQEASSIHLDPIELKRQVENVKSKVFMRNNLYLVQNRVVKSLKYMNPSLRMVFSFLNKGIKNILKLLRI